MLQIRDVDIDALKKRLSGRRQALDAAAVTAVRGIIADVKENGDRALFDYTRRFDGFDENESNVEVTREEIEAARTKTDARLVRIVETCARNIRAYHERQRRESWKVTEGGRTTGQLVRPLARVGVYVPGGKAAYPSSVLMNILPAKVACVKEIIMATPPGRTGEVDALTLVAADIAGAGRVLRIGGAQAVAALAYGTKSVPRVDKIVGPGNVYVAAAKREVFGEVGIDMIAGPSEVLIIADETANPAWIAADFLSQAEHDEMAACILIALGRGLAERAREEILAQLQRLPKRDIAGRAIENYGAILVAGDMREALRAANAVAPEHLELCVARPEDHIDGVENAGAVFAGHFSPEPLGDYFAGPNHVLPTNGTARFASPLSVDDFVKKTSLIAYDEQSLKEAYADIADFAEAEGLQAHARSVRIRFEPS